MLRGPNSRVHFKLGYIYLHMKAKLAFYTDIGKCYENKAKIFEFYIYLMFAKNIKNVKV